MTEKAVTGTSAPLSLEERQELEALRRELGEVRPQQATLTIENARLFNETQEALAQQTASADILRVISQSPSDVGPVFEAIAEHARVLCKAQIGAATRLIGDEVYLEAVRSISTEAEAAMRAVFPLRLDNTSPNIRRAILEQTPIQIPDVRDEPFYQRVDDTQQMGFRSIMSVPLLHKGRAIGTIGVAREEPGVFPPEAVALLQTFASQAVIAIENVRLFNETKEALELQTATAEVLEVISNSVKDTAPVFEKILQSCKRLLYATQLLLIRVGDDGLLHLGASVGGDGGREQQLFPMPLKGSATEQAIRERRLVAYGDVLNDVGVPAGLRKVARERGDESFACAVVPMILEGQAIGSILVRREANHLFSPKELALLKTFADQAVIAIENARLFEAEHARTKELQEALEYQTATSQVLGVISKSPESVEPVFESIITMAERLCHADFGFVYRKSPFGSYDLVAAPRAPTEYIAYRRQHSISPGDDSIMGRALAEHRPIHVSDVKSDAEQFETEVHRRSQIRSAIGVPLMSAGEPVGVFGLVRSTARAFTDRQVELVTTFADQAVIAIENARLINETKEALERQTATAEVLEVISNSISDATPVFEKILDSCQRLIPTRDLAVLTVDKDSLVHIASVRGPYGVMSANNYKPVPIEDTIIAAAVERRTTVHVADALGGQDVPDVIQRMAAKMGNISCLVAPMMWQGREVGAIFIARPFTKSQGRPFSPKDVSLLETFAGQAVIAIQNARLFNETKEALERQTATADILKVIASSPSDLQPVFEAIAERSNRLVDALSTTVFTLADGMMHLRAFTPITPEADAALLASFPTPLSPFSFGESIRKGEIYRVIDSEHEPESLRDLAQLRGWRSCLCVPLLRDGKPIGMIGPTRAEPGPFTDHHVQLLQTFADQAVIAISNVGLFNEVQERTRELSKSLEDLRTAQDRLVQTEKLASLGQLTAGIAHEIKNPLNFVNNFSALSAELIDELDETLAPAPLDQKMRGEVGELTQMLKSNFEKVVQHGKRADSIVKNMLLHSREGSGEKRPADINALLDESLNLAYHGARAEKPGFNITLQRDFDANAGVIEVFPQEINRAFLNLISNGFYAATRRKVDGDPDFEPVLNAATINLGDHVEIRIRDNGTGIPPEVKEKIFNPFFTTKPTGEGTGLGLSISHDIIVKQHGGRIEVETEPGLFTEFKIVLPRANQR